MGLRHGRALCVGELDPAQTADAGATASTPDTSSLPPPASIDCQRDALFLDFDGTLAEIAPAPELVAFFPETRALLRTLAERFGGAVAIITGRQISEIDRHLAPLELPVAGLYGLAHRSANGDIVDASAGLEPVAKAATRLKRFVERNPGLLLELKGQTLALHYRARPELMAECRAAVQACLAGKHGSKVIEGKMVIEMVPAAADKGAAVREFLREAPFLGRRPIYCGDDISDEAAFAAVKALDGVAVKVGIGPSAAHYRAPNISSLREWLRAISGEGTDAS